MWTLRNTVRPYAWGSRTALAGLQGRPVPSDGPEAELWLGAHPSAPSTVDGKPLTEVVAADPEGILGPLVAKEFGRLPYLLKVLAAEQPLSLQAHPDEKQARAGYEAEEAAGVPRDARNRSYVDPHHKPEILVAVGDFEALCGFRDPAAAAEDLRSLSVAALEPVIAALTAPASRTGETADGERIGAAVRVLMGWPEAERPGLVAAVAERHPLAASLAGRYPGDLGVVLALLLNHVRLRTDEAVFMPAGNLHAYLRGLGVEIMAASDNVLRGGLTPKHVDVPELLRVLRFEVLAEPVVRPERVADNLLTWRTPIREFALVKGEAGPGRPVTFPGGGPRILLSLRGTADAGGLRVGPGESIFVPASADPVTVAGDATVFQASPSL
jgi:mannose-6-phosphate isomerase